MICSRVSACEPELAIIAAGFVTAATLLVGGLIIGEPGVQEEWKARWMAREPGRIVDEDGLLAREDHPSDASPRQRARARQAVTWTPMCWRPARPFTW